MEDVISAILNAMNVIYHAHQAREKTEETEHLKNRKMHNRTITEAKVQQLSALKYGTNPIERFEKFEEEVNELGEAIMNYSYNPTIENKEKVKEELGDCYFILTAIIGIFETNKRELTETTIHKIKQREIDPNFKKQTK